MGIERVHYYVAECDNCGDTQIYQGTEQKIIHAMRRDLWIYNPLRHRALCPSCAATLSHREKIALYCNLELKGD